MIHVGTNTMNSYVSTKCIAVSTLEKVMVLNSDRHSVSLLPILLRKDSPKNKSNEVNDHLKNSVKKRTLS